MGISNHNSGPKQVDVADLIRSLKLWLRYMFSKWWIICIVGLLGGCIGFYIAYSDKAKYESHLTFALEEGDGGLGGALGFAAEFGLNIGGSRNIFEGDNILSLLTSRRILERVLLSVDTLNGQPITMADYYKKTLSDSSEKSVQSKKAGGDSRLINISFPVGQPRESFSYLQDSVLMNFYQEFATGGGLKVGKPDKRLNLYEVNVTSSNERFSKVFTDRLISVATDFYVELKTNKSKQILEVLESRVSQTKGNLSNAISTRAGIQDANVNPVFQQAQAELQKKQVDITAYSGAYGELYKNLELARFQYLKDIPLLQIIDGADYPMKKIKKGKGITAFIYAFFAGFIIIIFLTLYYFLFTKLEENGVDKDQ